MMAERLQGYRMDVNNPNTKGFVPGVVRELLDHIAQLEAQRGELARELDLTKREAWTAKERHKDERDRADGLRERLDELNAEDFAKAQRGGAVVVPELTDIELSACERLARMCRKSPSLVEGYLDDIKPWEAAEAIEKAATRQAIPADRVMADGMVGVDREAITRLSTAIDDVVITSAHHAIGSIEDKAVSVLCMAFSPIAKALRAQQAKGE